jgi:hypothetical protein
MHPEDRGNIFLQNGALHVQRINSHKSTVAPRPPRLPWPLRVVRILSDSSGDADTVASQAARLPNNCFLPTRLHGVIPQYAFTVPIHRHRAPVLSTNSEHSWNNKRISVGWNTAASSNCLRNYVVGLGGGGGGERGGGNVYKK